MIDQPTTVRQLERRSLSCRTLLHEVRELYNLDDHASSYPYLHRGPLNLNLCSSCEHGSHQLCVRRLERAEGAPFVPCRCLCLNADVPTFIRQPADPLRADVIRGERSPLDGAWVRTDAIPVCPTVQYALHGDDPCRP